MKVLFLAILLFSQLFADRRDDVLRRRIDSEKQTSAIQIIHVTLPEKIIVGFVENKFSKEIIASFPNIEFKSVFFNDKNYHLFETTNCETFFNYLLSKNHDCIFMHNHYKSQKHLIIKFGFTESYSSLNKSFVEKISNSFPNIKKTIIISSKITTKEPKRGSVYIETTKVELSPEVLSILSGNTKSD